MVYVAGNHQKYSLEAAAVMLFGPLRQAERRLLLALPKGERAFAGPEGADLTAPENDPEHSDQWGEEREVRVALLRWLCIDPNARAFVSPEGVRLAGARFDDRLVLSFVTVPFPLRLAACCFPKGIAIEGAALPSLGLVRCWIGQLPSAEAAEAAVMASNLRVAGYLTLDHTRTVGEIRLFGAEIGKTFNCEGASLRNAGARALDCELAKIGGPALLRYGFTSEGEVRFFNATIGGLDCSRGSFMNAARPALDCEAAKIGSAVYLRSGFSAQGELRFRGTQIEGNLDCAGASVKNAGGVTLRCTGSKINGSAFLSSNFSVRAAPSRLATTSAAPLRSAPRRLVWLSWRQQARAVEPLARAGARRRCRRGSVRQLASSATAVARWCAATSVTSAIVSSSGWDGGRASTATEYLKGRQLDPPRRLQAA
jgi:hypothetical protein